MDENVYILQKDLPYAKSGAAYHFRDGNYVCNDTEYLSEDIEHDTLKRTVVENNPDWFKPERVKVTMWASADCKVFTIKVDEKYHTISIDQKYTEKDMRRCFEEAQIWFTQLNPNEPYCSIHKLKHNNFDDYLKTLNQ